MAKNSAAAAKALVRASSEATADLTSEGVAEIYNQLRHLLADVFALYVKTKNFHWHMSGVHFRDYHLLLDEHAEQIFDMSDDVAERARKIGGNTLRPIADIARLQSLQYNDKESLNRRDMEIDPRPEDRELPRFRRLAHEIVEKQNDVAIAGVIENWIDQK